MKAEKKELLLWLTEHKNTQAMRDFIVNHEFSLAEIRWLRTHMKLELKTEIKKKADGARNAAA